MKNGMKKNAITLAITMVAAGSIFAAMAYNGSQIDKSGHQPRGPRAEQSQSTSDNPTTRALTIESTAKVDRSLQASSVLKNDTTGTTGGLSSVEEQGNETASYQRIAVQTTQPASYRAEVVGYGETTPHYSLSLSSEVSGRVISLEDQFEVGVVVEQGTVLARLDQVAYQQAVTQAEADVASARLALLEEQRQGEQAKSEWERSGLTGEPSSPLVLREPQLASAQATLVNAQQALEKAKSDLESTEITAPFDALIIEREIQPGSYLTAGSTIATLYSIDRVEVEIPLSEQQWSTLPNTATMNEWQISLKDSNGNQSWSARAERSYQHVAQDTRQRSLIVVVDNPLTQETPLYPGTFVQATLQGAEIDNLWEVPASALSQQGEVWTVDAEGLLMKASAEKQFEFNDKVYLTPITEESAQVVLRPLSSFSVGTKVAPSEEG